ncbi:MAG: Spore germination protein A1 [Firmicutes bacterium ADurb.Bin182]|nr:MAG: Spore germination protein A1 [Firmicutes bacterium ADurb.Bin182]
MPENKNGLEKYIEALEAMDFKMTKRSITFDGGFLRILYVQHMTDRTALSDLAIKPLSKYFLNYNADRGPVNAKMLMHNVIHTDDCWTDTDKEKIRDLILNGMTVIIVSADEEYIVLNHKKVEHRSVDKPEIEYTLRGPKDSFVENLDVNLSLIRYRLKDPKLRIRFFKVGRRTKTDVAMLYIEDIANENVVKQVQGKIERINVDGISESGELQAFLQGKYTIFPKLGLVERSDSAYHLLTEGRVLILVEGSGIAISAPQTFPEFFYSCDDRYDNAFFGFFMRLFRYIALLISLMTTSIYIGITSYHMDAVPSEYTIALAEMRSKVPFSSLTGALLVEFLMELFREALLRVPKQIGSAVGIVAAIVIGQAATAAGIFSPLLLILVATSLLSSFALPDYSLVTPFRIFKFIGLLATGTFGFYGLILFVCLLLINIVSAESFGVPYFAPFAPANRYDLIRSFFYNVTMSPERIKYLRSKDSTRTDE